jgi:hypothetical protein
MEARRPMGGCPYFTNAWEAQVVVLAAFYLLDLTPFPKKYHPIKSLHLHKIDAALL